MGWVLSSPLSTLHYISFSALTMFPGPLHCWGSVLDVPSLPNKAPKLLLALFLLLETGKKRNYGGGKSVG